ncbi:MAG: hypothetical protein KatS3mg083_263 [Candidatus Dojkabacteria bacterium]|nr:MAG: hypothetical protein KatS3mg083_263 [Candidatus Dojkabacteria bacterium]
MKYTNEEIKKGLAERDDDVLKWFITRFKPYFIKICLSYIQNKEQCEDISHEVIMKVISKIDMYDENRNFKSWLSKIASNYVIDQYRKMNTKAHKQTPVRLNGKILVYFLDVNYQKFQSREEELEASLHKAEMLECIRQGLLMIEKENEYSVLKMKYVDNMSYNDMAEYLNVDKNRIKALIYQEKNKIRAYAYDCMKKWGHCFEC